MLFETVALAARTGIDPEQALRAANAAFESRIRERESQFQWTHPDASPRAEPAGTAVFGVLVLGLLVLAALLLRRRRTVATRD